MGYICICFFKNIFPSLKIYPIDKFTTQWFISVHWPHFTWSFLVSHNILWILGWINTVWNFTQNLLFIGTWYKCKVVCLLFWVGRNKLLGNGKTKSSNEIIHLFFYTIYTWISSTVLSVVLCLHDHNKRALSIIHQNPQPILWDHPPMQCSQRPAYPTRFK